MSDAFISPTTATHAARLEGVAKSSSSAPRPASTPAAARTADELDLSNRAVLLSRLRDLPAVRADLVQRIKSEINTGAYDSTDKLEQALDAMVREISSRQAD